jgi:hypothetical protein
MPRASFSCNIHSSRPPWRRVAGRRGLYGVGGVGATQFSPGAGGYSSEFKPSLNVGLGYYVPLGERLALRVEARGYLTFVNSSGGFLCSGGCVVILRSDAFTQYEAKVGLTARF